MRVEHGWFMYAEKWGITARVGYDVVQTWVRVYPEEEEEEEEEEPNASMKLGHEVDVERINGV